jgi:hypothetical protein
MSMSATAIDHTARPTKTEKTPPAKAARDFVEANPAAADNPFGKLVSQFAKGETPA